MLSLESQTPSYQVAALAGPVPVFVIGYCLIWLLSVKLGWFPVQGYQSIADGFGGFIHRLILPTVSLATIYIALIARITRASVLEVLEEDYIRTARAKGQTETKVLLRHALGNAAVPIVTVIGLGVAFLIGGFHQLGIYDDGIERSDIN